MLNKDLIEWHLKKLSHKNPGPKPGTQKWQMKFLKKSKEDLISGDNGMGKPLPQGERDKRSSFNIFITIIYWIIFAICQIHHICYFINTDNLSLAVIIKIIVIIIISIFVQMFFMKAKFWTKIHISISNSSTDKVCYFIITTIALFILYFITFR